MLLLIRVILALQGIVQHIHVKTLCIHSYGKQGPMGSNVDQTLLQLCVVGLICLQWEHAWKQLGE